MNDGQVAELRRRFEKEYLPIRLGNWSKVNCEFRHRYCQINNENNKNSCNPDIGCRFIDDDQTLPKISSREEEIANTIKKLDEYFLSTRMPVSSSPDIKVDPNFMKIEKDPPEQLPASRSPDSAIYMNLTTPLNLSDSLADLDQEQEEEWHCKLGIVKVYVEFESRKFHCEGCGCTFLSIDDAADHLLPSNHPAKAPIGWKMITENANEELIPIQNVIDDVGCENIISCNNKSSQDAEDDKLGLDQGDGRADDDNESTERSQESPKDGKEYTFGEYATLQKKKNSKDDHDSDSLSKSDLELMKIIAFEEGEKKKKKKNKAWRFIKGSFMLIVRILF